MQTIRAGFGVDSGEQAVQGAAESRSTRPVMAQPPCFDDPDAEQDPAAEPAAKAGGMGRRRVLVHASGFKQSPYADIRPPGEDTKHGVPRKLWHSSPRKLAALRTCDARGPSQRRRSPMPSLGTARSALDPVPLRRRTRLLEGDCAWSNVAARSGPPWSGTPCRRCSQPGPWTRPDRPLEVVDLGGGTGGLAVRIAELGHHVVVVDPSPDALASLERRAADAGMVDGRQEQGSGTVRGVLGDAATLPDVVPPGSADVVVCHGVLEVVDVPAQALDAAARALAPGGALSLLAAQRSGGRLRAGDRSGTSPTPAPCWPTPTGDGGAATRCRDASPATSCVDLLGAAGFTVGEIRGVRVFADHLSSSRRRVRARGRRAVRALEAEVATHPDFIAIATQLHLLATQS